MKVLIDIPQERYERLDYVDSLALKEIIKNSTILPDKLTNGAVICMLYPNLKYIIQNDRVVTTIGVASSFDLDWWNTPYERSTDADSD